MIGKRKAAEPVIEELPEPAPESLGQAIDRLGIKADPSHAALFGKATKAMVLLVIPDDDIPAAEAVLVVPAGATSAMEAAGIVATAGAQFFGPAQDEAVRRARRMLDPAARG